MAKKNVFVSFDYEHDRHYKSLLNAWDQNPIFDFGFSDRSVTKPINSEDEVRIKAGITAKMNKATYCLVIIGKETHTSDWVNWEIENAHKLGLKIVAVKQDALYTSPDSILGKNASWAKSFKQESIINALESASQKKT